jgi:hypothetical protein
MTYTLKLDWTLNRVNAVSRILHNNPQTRRQAADLGFGWREYEPETMGESEILKLDWARQATDRVIVVLASYIADSGDALERARDSHGTDDYGELVQMQAQAFAALQDIIEYVSFSRANIPGYTG